MKNVSNFVINDMQDINHLINIIIELCRKDISKKELIRIESNLRKIKKILEVYVNE